MKFISLEESNKSNKKLVIKFSEPTLMIHFGSKNSLTYLDHHDKHKRSNYLKRKKGKRNGRGEKVFLFEFSGYLCENPF